MASKKKLTTTLVAVTAAAALLLSGTFAWQSINQTALNEASDVINPGGRLHDDFNGENKDIYVENFADEDIYARIQLSEYFEIIANYGAGEGIETSTQLLGSKNDDGTYNYTLFNNYASLTEGTLAAGVKANTEYSADAEEGADGYAYWSWKTGGSTVYMPTFNLNKDSLAADINGIYEDGNVGTISDRILDMTDPNAQYSEYKEYTDGEELPGTEIYDADANDIEDENVKEVEATHKAKPTGDATLISMADWTGEAGPYWVYDTDGWVYWAQAIEPGTATGLLLTGIELNQVMDDTWYYAINVVAQFVTANDVGKTDGTGFYDTSEGLPVPSAEAEELLRTIGVTSVDDEAGSAGGGTEEPVVKADGVHLSLAATPGEAVLTDGVWYYEGSVPEEGATETWDVDAELWDSGSVVTEDVTYSYEITATDTFRSAPEVDESGYQTMDGFYSFNTTSGELVMSGTLLPLYDFTIAVTATNDEGTELGSETINLLRAVPIYLYTYDADNNTVITGETFSTVNSGESAYAQLSSDALQSYQRMEDTYELAEGSCSCLTFTYSGDGRYQVEHSADGECSGEGGTAVVYFTDYPQVRAEYTVYCSEGDGESNTSKYTQDDSIELTFASYGEIDQKAYEDPENYKKLYLEASLRDISYDAGSVSYVICDKNGNAIDTALVTESEINEDEKYLYVFTDVPEGTEIGDSFTAVVYYTLDGVTYGKSAAAAWAGECPPVVLLEVDYGDGTSATFNSQASGLDTILSIDVSPNGNDFDILCEDTSITSWEITEAEGVTVSNTTITVAEGDSTPAFDLIGLDANGNEVVRVNCKVERKTA